LRILDIPGTIDQIPNLKHTLGANTFDLIFVDEAHHSRANSWTNVLRAFSSAKQILLTATPFRRDKKDLRARLVYNFPLKQAYEEQLFSRIDYVGVNTDSLNTENEKNIAIARKAEEVYKNRRYIDHKIIVRTDAKANADSLYKIYKENTDLNLLLIHSNLSERVISDRIKKLTKGEIDGVICVNMMGEGYDFPLLKIAAVHIPHKSLAITLQFIGRISRTNTQEGKIATVIAGEHEFKIEAEQLYKKDSKDWYTVLPDLHKAKIQKTEEEQEFFDSFEDMTEPQVQNPTENDEPITIDDDDLLPFFHAKLYKLFQTGNEKQENLIDISRVIDFESTKALDNPIVRHHHVSTEHEVAIHVVSELKRPKWYTATNVLNDIQNQLFIIFFDSNSSILFICATVKENELYEDIASQYLEDGVSSELIYLPHLKRVMAGWKDPKLYNLGMKSRKAKGNSESYKQLLGSLAQKGILPTDKYSYTRGHSFGGGYDTVLDKEVLLGVSTSSKIWSLDEKKIKYLVDWFKGIARKINDPLMDNLPLPLSELDSGKVLENFPTGNNAFFADWDNSQYYKLTTIGFLDNDGVVVEEGLLCSCSVSIIDTSSTHLLIVIRKGIAECKVKYTINPNILYEYAEDTTSKIFIKQGNTFSNPDKFLINLKSNPIHIYYENLSHLVGKVLFEFTDNINVINDQQIIAHEWPDTVNVQKEFYSDNERNANKLAGDNRDSIHDYFIAVAKEEFDAVFYDHASLEIADIIGFKQGKIKFYHCKKQDGNTPRCTVDDIYEVNGQAVKSVNWANRRLLIKQIYDRADQNKSNSKVKKGTIELIKQILESFDNPIIPIEIVIVLPGLKTTGLTAGQNNALNRIKTLLSSSDSYLKDVSSCSLSVICS